MVIFLPVSNFFKISCKIFLLGKWDSMHWQWGSFAKKEVENGDGIKI